MHQRNEVKEEQDGGLDKGSNWRRSRGQAIMGRKEKLNKEDGYEDGKRQVRLLQQPLQQIIVAR